MTDPTSDERAAYRRGYRAGFQVGRYGRVFTPAPELLPVASAPPAAPGIPLVDQDGPLAMRCHFCGHAETVMPSLASAHGWDWFTGFAPKRFEVCRDCRRSRAAEVEDLMARTRLQSEWPKRERQRRAARGRITDSSRPPAG